MRLPQLLLVALAGIVFFGCKSAPKRLENSPVVVTEVHFAASDSQPPKSEYIEIANIGEEDVDISLWQVTGAGRTEIPDGTVLAPREALVLCENEWSCETIAGRELERVVLFVGKLKRKGEVIRVETRDGLVADEVAYDPAVPAVEAATGTGKSLHRDDPRGIGAEGTWKAADPTPGRL